MGRIAKPKTEKTNKNKNESSAEEVRVLYSATCNRKGTTFSFYTYEEDALVTWCNEMRKQGLKPKRQKTTTTYMETRVSVAI